MQFGKRSTAWIVAAHLVVGLLVATVLATAAPAAPAAPAAAAERSAPPAAPRRLQASVDAATGSVTLRWRPPSTAYDGINVYLWYGGDPTRYGPYSVTSPRSHRTTCNLTVGCSYAVVAFNADGESAPSNRVFVGGEVPLAPTGLAAAVRADTGAVQLSWSLPAGGPARTGAGLYVWYGSDPTRYGPYSVATATSHATTCNLAQGCSYAVVARNAAGESMPSNRVFVGGEVPRSPTGLAATVDAATGEVDLAWSLPAGGPRRSGVAVYVRYGGDPTRYGPYSVATATSHATTCNLAQGCSYEVVAQNAAGQSLPSNRVHVGGEVPGPPSGLSATVTDEAAQAVRLSWSSGTGAVTGHAFYVWHGDDPTRYGPYSVQADTSHTTTCNLVEGCTYAVVAVNAAGTSAESDRDSVGDVEDAPGAAVGQAAVTPSGLGTITLSPSGPGIRWERRVGASAWGETVSPSTCPDPVAGCSYRAFGIGNTSDSSSGAIALDTSGPERVANVAGVRSSGEVQSLTWDAPSDSGAWDVATYSVERSLDAWPDAPRGWHEVRRVDGDVTSTDVACPGQEQGVGCRLRVVAHTMAGASAPTTAGCGEPAAGTVDLAPSCRAPVRLDDGSWDEFAADWAATPGVTPVPGGSVAVLEQTGPGNRLLAPTACEGWGEWPVPEGDGWCWPIAEQNDPLWYPQGIAVNDEVGGWWSGRGLAAVSWYRRTHPDGADTSDRNRVTLIDPASRQFAHLTLVEATGCPAACTLTPVSVHAGGVALVGRWLYVVDTAVGFRVFDVEDAGRARLVEGPRAPVEHVLRQVAEYRIGSGNLRFSSVDVDQRMAGEAGIGALVVTEYLSGRAGARMVRFPVGTDGRLAVGADGTVRSVATEVATGDAITNLQGGAVCRGRHLANRSRGHDAGTMFDLVLNGPATEHGWLVGPEDLACDGSGVWALTEHPGVVNEHPPLRLIVRVPVDAFD